MKTDPTLEEAREALDRQWNSRIGGLFGRACDITSAVEDLARAAAREEIRSAGGGGRTRDDRIEDDLRDLYGVAAPAADQWAEFDRWAPAHQSTYLSQRILTSLRGDDHLSNGWIEGFSLAALKEAQEPLTKAIEHWRATIADLARELAEVRAFTGNITERLQGICHRHGCLGGQNRVDFIEAKLDDKDRRIEAALMALRDGSSGHVSPSWKVKTALAALTEAGRTALAPQEEEQRHGS